MLTKGDTLDLPAFELLEEEGLTITEAMPRVADVAAQILSQQQKKIESQLSTKKYPPKAYLAMASELLGISNDVYSNVDDIHADMDQEGANCTLLLKCTTDALDGLELQKLITSTQQTNIGLNIEYAVKR